MGDVEVQKLGMQNSEAQNTGTQPIEKKRGIWLTIWLSFMLIANSLTALTYFIFNKSAISSFPEVAMWTWYIYGLFGLINFVLAIFLFMWKKWAFFAFCVVAIIAFIMNLSIGLGIGGAILGLTGPVILYFSMKSRWDLFE